MKFTNQLSLFAANNLTYEIPAGVDNNHFSIDPIRGIVTTNNHFDREQKDFYIIPVYVMDATNQRKRNQRERAIDKGIGTIVGNSYFDVAMIHVKVLDVNDHAPKFNPGSCYQLTIPENNEEAIVHTVVAIDLDDGPNSDIFYTITGNYRFFFKQYHLSVYFIGEILLFILNTV